MIQSLKKIFPFCENSIDEASKAVLEASIPPLPFTPPIAAWTP